MGLLAGEDDLAGIVFHPLEQDLDGLARLRMRFVFPLAKGHQPLGFVADIDDDLVTHHFHDLARDDGADLEALPLAQEMVGVLLPSSAVTTAVSSSSLTSNSRRKW